MPFIPHTPETLVSRADSKNPATTCKGITSNGRPCRRALSSSRGSSPNVKGSPRDGVVAFISGGGDNHEGAAAFFCWQHKEQAERLVTQTPNNESGVVQLQGRSSLDTLVDRLGILELGANGAPTIDRHAKNNKARPARKEQLPKEWRNVPGPLLTTSSPNVISEKHRSTEHDRQRPRPQTNLFFSLSCCMRSSEPNEFMPATVLRGSDRRAESQAKTAKMPSTVRRPDVFTPNLAPRKRHIDRTSAGPYALGSAMASPLETQGNRPHLARDPPSRTQEFLALLPKNLSPHTTSLLLAELAKPISDHDERGYIYMFWLTPQTSPIPTQQATNALLQPSRPNTSSRTGRTSDSIRQSYPSTLTTKPTILLKIGRASNVQRRMNEWSRQCNHNLSVLRYYPYLPSSPRPSPQSPFPSPSSPTPTSPRQVPHAHKVERLIHLELAHLRVKRGCAACGKEHREWFEVEGCREGIEEVDRVVRRWVDYGMMSM